MNLKDLEYVKAVAHYKHFRKAADACFVSQPTLSGQIKKLEETLNTQLFDRSTKHVTLTPQGERLLTQINVILEQTKVLKELAQQSQGDLQGEIKVGVIPTIAPYLLTVLLTSMKADFPATQFSFIEMQTKDILQALDDGELDMAILADVPKLESYAKYSLYKEDFLVAVSSEQALANKAKVALNELSGCDLLMLSEGHCFKDQAEQFCFAAGVEVSDQYQGNSLETLLALVAINDGVTFVPKLAAMPRSGISYVGIFPAQQRQVVMACRKHYPFSQGVEKLANWLSRHNKLQAHLAS